jgi:hypothetical protein
MTNNSYDLPLKVLPIIIFSVLWTLFRKYRKDVFVFENPLVFYSHYIVSIIFITGQITTMAFYMLEFGFIACILHNVLERKIMIYLESTG